MLNLEKHNQFKDNNTVTREPLDFSRDQAAFVQGEIINRTARNDSNFDLALAVKGWEGAGRFLTSRFLGQELAKWADDFLLGKCR